MLLMAVALVGAALAAWQAFDTRNWPIPVAVGLYLVVSIGGEVYSSVLQRFIVTPNEQVRESPFIEHNIAATRRAFALETVEERPLSGDALLTPRRHHQQRRDPGERPALGSPAAARDVRADPGDPHLLRFRVGRQRSLSHQRRASSGHAVGARAELGKPAEPHLGERAIDLHSWLRADARSGEPGDQRGTSGTVRARPAAADRQSI